METQVKTGINTVQVSYRLPLKLVARLRKISERLRKQETFPRQGPSQTDIVIHGIELALQKLERNS
jgi:hypothetical protein